MISRIMYFLLLLILLNGCSSLTDNGMKILDIHMSNILIQGENVVFKQGGNTYIAEGEASKFNTLKDQKLSLFQQYNEASEEEKQKIKVSWFIRFADYDGKIVIME